MNKHHEQQDDPVEIIAKLMLQNEHLKNSLSQNQSSYSGSSRGTHSHHHQNKKDDDFVFDFDKKSKNSKQSNQTKNSTNTWNSPESQFKKFKGEHNIYYDKESSNNKQNGYDHRFKQGNNRSSGEDKHSRGGNNRSRAGDNNSMAPSHKVYDYDYKEREKYEKWKRQQDNEENKRYERKKQEESEKKMDESNKGKDHKKKKSLDSQDLLHWNKQDKKVQDLLAIFKQSYQQFYEYTQCKFQRESTSNSLSINSKDNRIKALRSNSNAYQIIFIKRPFTSNTSAAPKVVWLGFQIVGDARIGFCTKQDAINKYGYYYCQKQEIQIGGPKYNSLGQNSLKLKENTSAVLMGYIPKTQQIHIIIKEYEGQQHFRQQCFKLPLKGKEQTYYFYLMISEKTMAWLGPSTCFDPYMDSHNQYHDWMYRNWFEDFRGKWNCW